MCSVSTFIQVHTDWQKYWQVLQCSLTKLYTYSQIYSLVEYLSDGLPVYAPIRPLLRTCLCTRFTHRSSLTDRSQPIRFSACTIDPTNVELVSQQVPHIDFLELHGKQAKRSKRHIKANFCVPVGCKIWKNGSVDGMQHTCFMMHH